MCAKSRFASLFRLGCNAVLAGGLVLSVANLQVSAVSAHQDYAGVITPAGRENDEGQAVIMVPGTIAVEARIQQSVMMALSEATQRPGDATYFAITDMRMEADQALVSVAGFVQLNEDLHWNLEDDATWLGLVLLRRTETGDWIGVTEGTQEFSSVVLDVPTAILDDAAKRNLASRPVLEGSNYVFPWRAGSSMFYGPLGVHPVGYPSGWQAVDMASDGDTSQGHASGAVVAAESATVRYVCNDGTATSVLMGNFLYTHMRFNSKLYVGKSFTQGEEMGWLKSGTFSAPCGYAYQPAGWFHLHWGFPATNLSVEGWTLGMSTQNWTDGSTTIRPNGGWITAGVDSLAPALSGNAAAPDAVLSYYDNGPRSVRANAAGDYWFKVTAGWSGTVTPSRKGCTFTPSSRSYIDVTADTSAEGYSAICTETFRSVGTYDGWVRESRETADVGGSLESGAPTARLGDNSANKQYRAILSFNTGGLPDAGQILSASLRLLNTGQSGDDPFASLGDITADIRRGSFGTKKSLQKMDFQAAASAEDVMTFTEAPVETWYSSAIDYGSLVHINLGGVTQFRLRFLIDDDNDLLADSLGFYTGNGDSAMRPQLIITYQVP